MSAVERVVAVTVSKPRTAAERLGERLSANGTAWGDKPHTNKGDPTTHSGRHRNRKALLVSMLGSVILLLRKRLQ
jgi:hypothetical protein